MCMWLMLCTSGGAQTELRPFRDQGLLKWGYRSANGRIAIPPRFEGAGVFRDGRAPVKDAEGFAIIDDTGLVVQRIPIDSVSPGTGAVPPPADGCAWSPGGPFFSTGMACDVRQLRGSAPAIGGEITIHPGPGEPSRRAIILKLPTGVVVHEEIGYEGFQRRVLLPGVSAEQAREWQRKLYPDIPGGDGCSESWEAGVIPGGAYIEQGGGC